MFYFSNIVLNNIIAQNNIDKPSTIYSTDTLKTPVLLSPSTKKYFIVNTLTPTFSWSFIDSANGYTLYLLNKKSNRTSDGFFSSYYGVISKNKFTIPENILKDKTEYLIFLRAFNTNSWSNYSDTVKFKIILPREEKKTQSDLLPPPEIISKNNLIIDTSDNNQKNNGLRWYKTNNKSEYQIIIDGINSSNIFGEEYINVLNETTRDTIFYITPDIFTNFSKFRWKVRSNQNGRWSRFSNYFYFSLAKGNEDYTNNIKFEEVLLKTKYTNLVDEIILAKIDGEKVLLPFLEILSILQNNHKSDLINKTITGKRFDNEETNYNVDIGKRKFNIGKDEFNISEENILETELEYYLSKEIIEKILNIEMFVDLRKLTVTISSIVKLPMLERLLNEQKMLFNKKKGTERRSLNIYDKNWNYLEGGFFDYSVTSSFIKNQSPYHSFQFGLGGELLGGDLQMFNQNAYFKNKFINNNFTARWRYVFLNNPYISNLSLGNNVALGLQSYDYKGIRISNEPIETRRNYGRYKIEEKTYPHWKVEVYQNNQLIDIVEADINGTYYFSIPFTYGTTLIELRQFGNNGEFKNERKMYQIPINQLPEGQFDYALNVGQLYNKKEGLVQSYAAYGVNNWLTTKIGTDIFTNKFNNSTIYNNTSLRFLEGNVLDLTIAPNAFQELSVNSLFSNLANINLGVKYYQQNESFNPSGITNEFNGSIFLPFRINNNQISLFLKGKKTNQKLAKRYDAEARLFYNIDNLTPSLEFEHFNFTSASSSFRSSFLNFRINYSFRYFSKLFTGNVFDSRIKYDLTNNKFESIYAALSTTIWKNYRVQLTHTINFNANYSDTQLRIIFDLPFFRSNSNISKSSFSQSIFGSINYSHSNNKIEFHNRGMVGKSAAAIKFYLDQNGNDQYDHGEKQIPDMDISINSVGDKVNLNNKLIFVNDLQQYTLYNAKLIDRNNKNPLWIPKFKEFSFLTDPNQFKEINIPFYETGEVNGKVIKELENKTIPVSGITLIFENKLNGKQVKIKTMSNGSFYKYGIIPGEYRIKIPEEQLNKMKLKPDNEDITIKIKSISNTIVEDEIKIILINSY